MIAVTAPLALGVKALPARRVQARRCAAAKVVRASQPVVAKAEAKVAAAAVAGTSFALVANEASAAVASMPQEVAQVALDTTPLYYFGFLGLFMAIAIALFVGLTKIKLI